MHLGSSPIKIEYIIDRVKLLSTEFQWKMCTIDLGCYLVFSGQ